MFENGLMLISNRILSKEFFKIEIYLESLRVKHTHVYAFTHTIRELDFFMTAY